MKRVLLVAVLAACFVGCNLLCVVHETSTKQILQAPAYKPTAVELTAAENIYEKGTSPKSKEAEIVLSALDKASAAANSKPVPVATIKSGSWSWFSGWRWLLFVVVIFEIVLFALTAYVKKYFDWFKPFKFQFWIIGLAFSALGKILKLAFAAVKPLVLHAIEHMKPALSKTLIKVHDLGNKLEGKDKNVASSNK
jgi:hypothetical protein